MHEKLFGRSQTQQVTDDMIIFVMILLFMVHLCLKENQLFHTSTKAALKLTSTADNKIHDSNETALVKLYLSISRLKCTHFEVDVGGRSFN